MLARPPNMPALAQKFDAIEREHDQIVLDRGVGFEGFNSPPDWLEFLARWEAANAQRAPVAGGYISLRLSPSLRSAAIAPLRLNSTPEVDSGRSSPAPVRSARREHSLYAIPQNTIARLSALAIGGWWCAVELLGRLWCAAAPRQHRNLPRWLVRAHLERVLRSRSAPAGLRALLRALSRSRASTLHLIYEPAAQPVSCAPKGVAIL